MLKSQTQFRSFLKQKWSNLCKTSGPLKKACDPYSYHFQSFTHLSWLAEATKPKTLDVAKEVTCPSCAAKVIVLFSCVFQSSKFWQEYKKFVKVEAEMKSQGFLPSCRLGRITIGHGTAQ